MKKSYLALLGLLLVFIISHIFYYKTGVEKINEQICKQKAKQIKKMFQMEVDKKFGKTFELAYVLSKNDNLVKALRDKDNSSLNYQEIVTELRRIGEYKNLWVHVIDKDGYSFYRSWTKKTGDHIASVRVDVMDTIKHPDYKKLISVGRFDMTFKTMIPIYDKGEFLGIIELISRFNSIANIFQKQGIEPLMVVDEKYTKTFLNTFSRIFIGNNYIANINASRKIIEQVKRFGLKKLMHAKDTIFMGKYFVVTNEIKDVHGKDMGFFIFFVNKKDLDKSMLNSFYIEYLIKLLVNIVVFVLFVLFIINKNYALRLNKEVKKKTLKLQTTLEAYDKNVIFSTTDTNGKILHVSKAFCEVSGFSQKELIGKSHSIIWHPDMKKEIFTELWNTITNGKIWTGNIKNLRKDGSFYWTKTEIEPIFEHGNITGYTAIRQDITASREIEEVQRDIIFTMGSIGERRSNETGNHVKRVAEYSKLLALKMGLSEEEAQMLKQASPMHDIGKVAIPDSILNKPGKLSEQEMEVMKTHAKLGYEMLKHSTRPLLKTASIVALEHHEKWDGSGYPRGLKGEQIHIYGRITAVADVFDALGSKRCYKDAWEDERIFKLLREQSGNHFDPKLIEIFFENLEEFLAIRDNLRDKS